MLLPVDPGAAGRRDRRGRAILHHRDRRRPGRTRARADVPREHGRRSRHAVRVRGDAAGRLLDEEHADAARPDLHRRRTARQATSSRASRCRKRSISPGEPVRFVLELKAGTADKDRHRRWRPRPPPGDQQARSARRNAGLTRQAQAAPKRIADACSFSRHDGFDLAFIDQRPAAERPSRCCSSTALPRPISSTGCRRAG